MPPTPEPATSRTPFRSLILRPTGSLNNEEAALRWAICLDPDDDAPRLVFADWLTDHRREEEADLIKEMVRNPLLRRRIRPLRSTADSWPDAPGFHSCEVRRGFVQYITMNFRDFVRAAPRLFAFHPIVDVKLKGLWFDYGQPPLRHSVSLGTLEESGRHVWPAAFFPGLKHGTLLGFRLLTDVYGAISRGAVNYGRQTAGLPPLP